MQEEDVGIGRERKFFPDEIYHYRPAISQGFLFMF
jgi:hypothetical protein